MASCDPRLKFLVGMSLSGQLLSITRGVPSTRRPSTWGDVALVLLTPTAYSRKAAGSASSTRPVPRTTIALSFMWPITAPLPPRPGIRPASLTMHAYSTSRSPAGPMANTRALASPTSASRTSWTA